MTVDILSNELALALLVNENIPPNNVCFKCKIQWMTALSKKLGKLPLKI